MLQWVTDGGLETDLIFHRGTDLPEFAAFPLVEDPAGAQLLRDYYADYAAVATRAAAGLVLETPTWRASADWGAKLGYDRDALDSLVEVVERRRDQRLHRAQRVAERVSGNDGRIRRPLEPQGDDRVRVSRHLGACDGRERECQGEAFHSNRSASIVARFTYA